MNKITALLIFICSIGFAKAEFINIGIFKSKNIKEFYFEPRAGKYGVFSEAGKIKEVTSKSKLRVVYSDGKIKLYENHNFIGTYSKLNFIGIGWYNHFQINGIQPKGIKRRFDDNLKISVRKYGFRLLNNINLDNYVGGVVEAEVGRKPPKEYFKLQAIICRTYALSNTHKHLAEGYNLCDEVHCQAYHGKTFSSEIRDAALQTRGAVIVDSDIQLITAAFHSNCGGQTVNSEDVWTKSLYYLRSIKDTFCLHKKKSFWELKLSKHKWESYVNAKTGRNYSNDRITNYCSTERQNNFPDSTSDLRFEELRHKFKLRSTFFEITTEENFVYLDGRGFGHGVGLCQIGAMEMAKQNYKYSEILHFYYQGVHIIDLSAIDFFKEE